MTECTAQWHCFIVLIGLVCLWGSSLTSINCTSCYTFFFYVLFILMSPWDIKGSMRREARSTSGLSCMMLAEDKLNQKSLVWARLLLPASNLLIPSQATFYIIIIRHLENALQFNPPRKCGWHGYLHKEKESMLVKKQSWITCGRHGCKGLIKMCKKESLIMFCYAKVFN